MNFPGARYIDPAMQQFRPEQLAITVEKNGSRRFTKASNPTRFGKYAEIRTRDHEFHFNLDGQIRFIRGLGSDWPHPFEALKRTDGNDWVYYSVGAAIQQQGIHNWLGEIGKPLAVADIHEAFRKMTDVNRSHENIEITANFLLGDPLSPDHLQSLADLLGNVSDITPGKGAVYLSPMAGQHQESDELLQSFFEIKNKSRLPVFIYLIQRL